jgi:ABC-2 type transport system permease protein
VETLKLYLSFSRIAFKRQLTYKIANWAGLFTNTFFLFFRAAIFESAYLAREKVAGFSQMDAVTYIAVTQALIMVIPQWGFIGVDKDIRSGQIATEMCRPANYFLIILFKRMGISFYYLLMRTIPLLTIAAFAGLVKPIGSIVEGFFFLISVFLGAWLILSFHFLTEVSGFWLESSRGVKTVAISLVTFFSGMILPINYFPGWAKKISTLMPFQYCLDTPTQIYLGNTQNPMGVILWQILWIVILLFFCLYFLRKGERKLLINGG